MRGRGGSAPNRRGGSPVSTQRQNFFSAVMLVERIGRYGDLDPFTAARDDRERPANCMYPVRNIAYNQVTRQGLDRTIYIYVCRSYLDTNRPPDPSVFPKDE